MDMRTKKKVSIVVSAEGEPKVVCGACRIEAPADFTVEEFDSCNDAIDFLAQNEVLQGIYSSMESLCEGAEKEYVKKIKVIEEDLPEVD